MVSEVVALVAVLKRRWKLAPALLAELFGVSQGTIRGAVREAESDLDALGVAVEPGPNRPATVEELRAVIPAASGIKRHNETRD